MKELNILVGSKNGLKLESAEAGFQPSAVRVFGSKAPSEINEQPVGHEETLRGLFNRARNARLLSQDRSFDYLVVAENGIIPVPVPLKLGGIETAWFDLAWVLIEDKSGDLQALSSSTGIKYHPRYVEIARERGFATTTVGAVMAELLNSDPADPHSTLTNYLVSRKEMLTQAIRAAWGQLSYQIKND